jgi:hypothetical protein
MKNSDAKMFNIEKTFGMIIMNEHAKTAGIARADSQRLHE